MSTTPSSTPAPSLQVRFERALRPLQGGAFHLLLELLAPPAPVRSNRPPLDLAFVVDRSGSMGNGAFELARQGVEQALRLLDASDSISLVVYDQVIDTLLTQQLLDAEARAMALYRLRQVHPRGSTDLAGGWMAGCDQLAPLVDGTRRLRSGNARPITRVLLLTDGLANVGITHPAALAQHAAALRERGISTTTVGVGPRYDEVLLSGMADAGGGRFHHVATPAAIPDVFAGELGEMLHVVLRDVELAVRFPAAWSGATNLNALPHGQADGWMTMRLGDMFANDTRSLVWLALLPEAVEGTQEHVEVRLTWRDAAGQQAQSKLSSHPLTASSEPAEPDPRVLDAVAELRAAQAREEAMQLNRAGRYQDAQQVLYQVAASMPPTLLGRELKQELDDISTVAARMPLDPAMQKQLYARSNYARRSKRDYTDRR